MFGEIRIVEFIVLLVERYRLLVLRAMGPNDITTKSKGKNFIINLAFYLPTNQNIAFEG